MAIKKHIKSIPARLANKLSPLELETAKESATLDKYDLGLNEVDNTSDEDKPVSIAQQAALDEKEYVLTAGTGVTIDRSNPLAPVISTSAVDNGVNVLIDCGTIVSPNENLLIDCGSII